MNLSWQFEAREVDEKKGWDDTAIAQFRGNKLKSLVCEILQNSLDNPASSEQEDPVKVVFEVKERARDDIPNLDELSSRLCACK